MTNSRGETFSPGDLVEHIPSTVELQAGYICIVISTGMPIPMVGGSLISNHLLVLDETACLFEAWMEHLNLLSHRA